MKDTLIPITQVVGANATAVTICLTDVNSLLTTLSLTLATLYTIYKFFKEFKNK